MCKIISIFFLGLEMEDADYASIFTDIDLVILEINSESMLFYINIIKI